MTADPERGADPGAPVPEDKSQLLAAFDGVVNREREKAVEGRSLPIARRTHVVVAATCILAWAALVYVWVARPAWLAPSDESPALTPREQEVRLRFAVYLERERVLDFRASHHRLPVDLAEAGDVEDGVEYAVSGDSTFVVSATVRNALVTLNESQSAEDFLKPVGINPSRPK